MYHCFLIHSSADGHLGCFHDPIPAPCDFKAYRPNFNGVHFWDWFAPNTSNLLNVQAFAKEWVGRLARR